MSTARRTALKPGRLTPRRSRNTELPDLHEPHEAVEVIILSQPAVLDWPSSPSYWIFEMHVVDDALREEHPLADRAVRYLAPGEAPPEARAGERRLLTGSWQGDKTFRIDHLEQTTRE